MVRALYINRFYLPFFFLLLTMVPRTAFVIFIWAFTDFCRILSHRVYVQSDECHAAHARMYTRGIYVYHLRAPQPHNHTDHIHTDTRARAHV